MFHAILEMKCGNLLNCDACDMSPSLTFAVALSFVVICKKWSNRSVINFSLSFFLDAAAKISNDRAPTMNFKLVTQGQLRQNSF